MVNKPKSAGTRWEREVLLRFEAADIQVTRLAEGGVNDLGDLMIDDHGIVIEAKDRASMNVHGVLKDAVAKAKRGGFVAVVAWKRKGMKSGNTKRSPMGPPLVAMRLEDFIELLHRR